MGTLYGWCDVQPPAAGAAEIFARMRAADRLAGEPIDRLELATSAVSVSEGGTPASLLRKGEVLFVAEGRFQWRDAEAAALAREQGDSAAIARLYERHGNDCVRHLAGSFALAIVDPSNGSALLAVDRLGIRPLCYASRSGKLVFASTAGSVATHPSVGGELSDQGLFNYLYFHAVPSPGTVYRGVSKLLPGECVTFRNGRTERRFYWQLRYAERAAQSKAELERRFRGLLGEAVQRAISGEAEVGAFLSGGTDSSTVVGLLSELGGAPARTYSIGFAADGFDEMRYARITAAHFGAASREHYVTPEEVLEAIPIVAESYDEPFGNASAVPTYLCARLARADGVRVMLAGDGGDEIFGGNARYAWQKLFEPYAAIPGWLRAGLIEPVVLGLPGADRIAPWRKLRNYILQAKIPLPERLEAYNFLHRVLPAQVFEPDFLAGIDVAEPLALQREAYERAASRSALDRMMHLDLKSTLADNDLRKVVRMCEAAGVEARFPLLDDALVDFSGELPASFKVRGLRLRWFFKEALRDFLPAETVAKSKHGFGLPFGLWLRQHRGLSDLAQDSLAAFARRRIVRQDYIRSLLEQHRTGHATYFGVMIWVLMMLEHWLCARQRCAPRRALELAVLA